jgi:hypothetical protein
MALYIYTPFVHKPLGRDVARDCRTPEGSAGPTAVGDPNLWELALVRKTHV